jgi:predicted TIM-barrel fold metal-dependent hydrolase
MKIIDAHVHLIEFMAGFNRRGEMRPIGGGKARWASGEVWNLVPPGLGEYGFTGEKMLEIMDAHSVEKAVLVQGNASGYQNEYSYEMMKKYPGRFTAACTFDPFMLDVEKIKNRFFYEMRFPIVKFEAGTDCGLMSYHRPFPLDGEQMSPIYDEIEKNGQVLVMDVGRFTDASHQHGALVNIAKGHPAMKFVICHILLPSKGDDAELERQMNALDFDNVWFDLAALPLLLQGEPDPDALALHFIEIARKTAGPKRLMWGSDVPSTLQYNSYADLVGMIVKSGIFTDSELEDVFYNNAALVYPFGK